MVCGRENIFKKWVFMTAAATFVQCGVPPLSVQKNFCRWRKRQRGNFCGLDAKLEPMKEPKLRGGADVWTVKPTPTDPQSYCCSEWELVTTQVQDLSWIRGCLCSKLFGSHYNILHNCVGCYLIKFVLIFIVKPRWNQENPQPLFYCVNRSLQHLML